MITNYFMAGGVRAVPCLDSSLLRIDLPDGDALRSRSYNYYQLFA